MRGNFERELTDCVKKHYCSEEETDEDKPSAIASYIRNMIRQIDDKRRDLTFKQLTLF